MTTTYTFINPTAARLFADLWAKHHQTDWELNGKTVTLYISPHDVLGDRFTRAAEWFNAAAEKAREIGEDSK